MAMSLYALDGTCHNAEPGTFGHECGKPAKWLGTGPRGFAAGFCDDCMVNGWDAKDRTTWTPLGRVWRVEQWRAGLGDWIGWRVVRDQPESVAVEVAAYGEFRAPAGPVDGWRGRIAAQTLAVGLNRKELNQ